MRNLWLFFCFFLVTAYGISAPLQLIIRKDAPEVERTAAAELAEHFQMASGEKSIILEEKESLQGRRVYIGWTEFAKRQGLDFSSYDSEGWLVKAYGEEVLVIGGGFPRGTVYAAYEFLERQLGILWLDEWRTHVPKTAGIRWAADTDWRGKPSFAVRGLYSYFIADVKRRELFLTRNRQNFFHLKISPGSAAYARGMDNLTGAPNFNHTFYYYTKGLAPEDEDCLSYSKATGQRVRSNSSAGPGQICYSNPKTQQLISKKMLEYIAADRREKEAGRYPKYYVLAKNDNRNDCECPGCLELFKKHGSSGAQLEFTNRVAIEVGKTYPDILIQMDAYATGAFPPISEIKPAKNVRVLVALGHGDPKRYRDPFRSYRHPSNQVTRDIISDWSRIATLAIWDYWIDFYGRSQYPSTNVLAIAENLRFYHEQGIDYVFAECEKPSQVSLHALRIWMGYRMMNNIELDVRQEIQHFMQAYYGQAAPMLMQYHDLVQAGNDRLEASVCDMSVLARNDLDDSFFQRCEELFSAAERAEANNPVVLECIANERVAVDRARIERKHLLSEDLQPPFETVVDRYQNNAARRIKRYERTDIARRLLSALDQFCRGARAAIPPLTGFNPNAVIGDYAWPELSIDRYNNPVVEDAEAHGGMTVKPLSGVAENRGVILGVYDNSQRKYLTSQAMMPPEALPKDEKYHFYPMGRVTLSKQAFLYMNWTWHLQKSLQGVYTSPEVYGNKVEIFVSLKVQGPAYVPGSTQENLYAVDRLVICRGDIPSGYSSPWPLPEALVGRKVVHELAGTSLHAEKIPDEDSLISCALPAKCDFAFGFSAANATQVILQGDFPQPDDQKYHVYFLGTSPLYEDCQVYLGTQRKYRIELGDYYNMLKPERRFDLFVSIKKTNDQILLDRVFLVEP
ncbi:MAG: DUF4838 domain-containing protein [Lentisphaerae bacterium]|jgi:hypothetical protein|nr:DUF4838 domain-containing protein [Lentisphaerota bacterium]